MVPDFEWQKKLSDSIKTIYIKWSSNLDLGLWSLSKVSCATMKNGSHEAFKVPNGNNRKGPQVIDCAGKHIGKVELWTYSGLFIAVEFYYRDGSSSSYLCADGFGKEREDT